MKKIITLLFLGWLVTFSATAQVVYNVSPSSSSADPGATIFVDVTVENFVDMIGFQFDMEWNDQVLEFQNITTHDNILCNVNGNPSVCYSYPNGFGPANITNFFSTLYFDQNLLNPVLSTLANGDKLLTIEFLVVGQAGQSSPIDFAGAILAINEQGQEFSVSNGMLTANDGTFNVSGTGCAGAGDVTFTASDESGDTGTTGSIKVSVDNFENVEGFGYTINWDPSIISFTSIGNLNLTGLTYPNLPAVGSFGTSQASTGNLFVSWSNSSGVTACDGDIIFEIFYTVIGAGQTSTGVDFTGNIEVIRNSQLVPHTINSGSVMITGNGTGQQTGITFIAENITGETGTQVCVPVKVANFDQVISAQYDLTWDPSIISFATILDGAGQPLSPIGSGNPLGLLNPNPPAIGNFGTTNANNGVLSLSWDNGSGVTLTDQTPVYQVCYDIVGANGATSPIDYTGTIEVADVNGLADFTGVSGSVEVTEVFNGGLNLEWDCCEQANPGENICVDVRIVDGFDNILSAQYGMLWDNTVLTYESIAFGNGNPLGLSAGNNLVYDANADAVKLLWFDNNGQGITLAPGTSLYQVCFDVTGALGSNVDLEMGPIPSAIPPFGVEISNPQNTIDFLGNSCNVAVVNIAPITITETVTNPSCGGDTDGSIDITISGGVEAYSIAWSTTATSQNIADLAAGSYTVTVTDCRGDTAEKTITVTDPAPITATANVTQVTGAGNDGAVDLTPNGGTSNYTYIWSNGSVDQDLTGLSIGTYTVTITDTNGCTGTESFMVPNACNPITIGANVTPESSAGNDGEISAFSNGGMMPYEYVWNIAGGTNGNLTNLAAGTYTVTVTDLNGCTGTNSFTVDPFVCPTVTVSTQATAVICAGGSTGSATAAGAGGAGAYTYDWSNGVMNQQTISGLAANLYTVTATDVDGCFATTTVIVGGGASLLVNIVSTTNLTCFGVNTGLITVSGFGGTGDYNAVWQPGNMTGLTISNLAAGVYTPVITDTNTGCTVTGNPIALTQPSDIFTSGAATSVSCNGGSNGLIALNISGGTPGYSVTWSNGATGQNLNNLTAGSYTPTVTDDNGCVKVGSAIIVGQPAPITAIPTINNASCFGECDGSISLNISGGTTGYTATWSTGSTGTSISGLCAGNYSVTIQDANGCTFTDSYMVTQPAAFGLSFVVINESPAGNDGSINLTVSPSGNYSFLWSNGATTEDINSLTADVYTVIVTDIVSGCSAVGGDAVTNTLNIQTEIVTQVTCHGGDDGSIEITVSGGTPFYTYKWSTNGSPFTTTKDIFGQAAGIYTVEITDQAQPMPTTITEIYVITEPTAVTITNVIINNESNSCDGTINISASGGTGIPTYAWSNGATSQDIVNLCEGSYSVIVSDVNGCTFQSPEYVIEASAPQIGSVDVTDVSCFLECDGKICVNIVGGNPSYTVKLNGGNPTVSTATTVCFGGLCPGDYQIEVTDAQGLVDTSITYTIVGPTPISITNVLITNQSPNICNGTINISDSGGTGTLTYAWSNGATSQDLENLCMGMYSVTITDGNGCIFESPEYSVTKLTEIDADITSVGCFADSTGAIDLTVTGGFPPFSYLWIQLSTGDTISMNQDINNVSAGDYRVIITDEVTVVIYDATLNISQPPSPVSIISSTVIQPVPGDCDGGEVEVEAIGGNGGFTFSWVNQDGTPIDDIQVGNISTITGLIGGEYFLTVTDANGCIDDSFQTELEECQIGITVILSGTQLMVSCKDETDGTISVVGEGGDNPYTYEWSTGWTEIGMDGSSVEDLAAGTYTVIVTDANEVSAVEIYEVAEPAPIQVTVNVFPGRADAIVLGGTAPYTFQWDQIITTESFIEGLQGGIEHVLLVTDANGCTSEMVRFDLDYGTGCYEARTVISPNNDGLNDNFYVNCLELTTVRVIIFNRWGQEVYENDDYDNSFIGIGRRDEVLPQGGYFYILEYEGANGVIQTSRGSLSIVRTK
jgi:gliding motility-associated-like protein